MSYRCDYYIVIKFEDVLGNIIWYYMVGEYSIIFYIVFILFIGRVVVEFFCFFFQVYVMGKQEVNKGNFEGNYYKLMLYYKI